MRKNKKQKKIQREWFGKKNEMEKQKSYGFTKIMRVKTKIDILVLMIQ